MHLMYSLLPVIEANGDKYSSVGRLAKIQESLADLHNKEEGKTIEHTESLMLPTLGSQVSTVGASNSLMTLKLTKSIII